MGSKAACMKNDFSDKFDLKQICFSAKLDAETIFVSQNWPPAEKYGFGVKFRIILG